MYDLVDIARESVSGAIEKSGIGAADLERLTYTGDLERVVAVMVGATVEALEWGSQALGARPEKAELERIAVVAVFDVLAEIGGVTPDALRLVALVSGAAEWAGFEGRTDEEIRTVLEAAARDLELELRPTGTRDVVDEAGEIIARIVDV